MPLSFAVVHLCGAWSKAVSATGHFIQLEWRKNVRKVVVPMSVVLCSSVSRAQVGASVPAHLVEETLDVATCEPGPDREVFVELMQLELAGEAMAGSGLARLKECNLPRGEVTLQSGDAVVPVSVSDAPQEVRMRVLVVALVQTLHAVRTGEWAAEVIPQRQPEPQSTPTESPSARGAEVRDAPLGTWGLEAGALVSIWGPESSTAFGASMGVYRRVFSSWRLGAAMGYLTASDESNMGLARVHIVPLALRVEGEWGSNPAFRLGLGAQWSAVFVETQSRWGVEEASAMHSFAAGEVRTTVVIPVSRGVALTLGADVVTSFSGLELSAGAEPGFSFYGVGGQVRCGAEMAL